MPDKVLPGPIHGNAPCVKEAVCIHTKRIYDSCRDKECIENIRVYPTRCSQELLDCATSVKSREAELLWTNIDVHEVTFNRGFYSVDIKFFYKITAEVCSCSGRSQKVSGLAIYDKRVILFGSEGDVKIFNSRLSPCDKCASNMPQAFVEAVDHKRKGAVSSRLIYFYEWHRCYSKIRKGICGVDRLKICARCT